MKLFLLTFGLIMLSALFAFAGDNGDGTATNPVIYADYPDPDIIRVGEDFYFATTTFVNSPGLRILHSKDLVNWEIAGHVMPKLEGREQFDLKNGGDYRHGVFAPSLRFHNGTFYVVVSLIGKNTRIYYTKDPAGAWQFHELDRHAFDPGFFIDADGAGYIATSGAWDGHVTLLKLNEDFSKVVDSKGIHFIKGAEGSHIVKRNNYYYLFNSIPNRLGMTISRATSLYGPWETQNSIDDRLGGHQGAIVDLPDGNWFGFAMRDMNPVGRVTNFAPIRWENDWPVWGTAPAPGNIPQTFKIPLKPDPSLKIGTSDSFDSPKLGLQWQWNHNPDDSRWSLTDRPGYLRLKATTADSFWLARNSLTQKGMGPRSIGTVKLDLRNLKPGDQAGLGTLGKYSGHIAVKCNDAQKRTLVMNVLTDTGKGIETDARVKDQPIDAEEIFLRLTMDFTTAKARCDYSVDEKTWTNLGGDFPLAYDWRTGTFQGPQYAIFCFNNSASDGYVDVDSFAMKIEQVAAKSPLAIPQARQDPNSKIGHEQLVQKAKTGGIDLYFLGDSITRRWGCTDAIWAKNMENWKQNFFGYNAGNFGWGADGIQNILWRIQNGELDGVNPKVIVILAGTNNVGNKAGDDRKVNDIVGGLDAILATCHEKAPNAKIIVTGILIRNDAMEVVPEIRKINTELAKRADDKTIYYLDINDKLADADGKLLEGMTIDKLHLSPKGYQIWADGLKPILLKLMGPPATTDHAPPPTGDPSAQKPAK